MSQMTDTQYKLSKAKAQLIVEHPFYAALLTNLPFVERADVKTMAVDGKNVYYNPAFVNELTVNELKFVEAHEVMHCVFQHMSRRGSRDHKKWNIAGDYIINDILVTDKVGDMPKGGLHDPNLVKAGKSTTDGVYNLLPDGDGGDGGGSGGGQGEPLDEVWDQLTPDEKREVEEQWTIRAVQAAQAAKMCGKMSVGAQRLVDTLVKPKVDWRELLRRFVSKQTKTDRSFARPNRRFLSQGMYLPAMSGESLGEIAIAVDCSGSIDNNTLTQFASEIECIKNELRPSKINVLYFDSSVSHQESYSPDDALDIKPHGGGGTAFSPVIEAINEFDTAPDCCVFLTDLYCNDFGDAPDYPVLWVSNGDDKAPWGEVAVMTN